mgnify:CR=1 FL=1
MDSVNINDLKWKCFHNLERKKNWLQQNTDEIDNLQPDKQKFQFLINKNKNSEWCNYCFF